MVLPEQPVQLQRALVQRLQVVRVQVVLLAPPAVPQAWRVVRHRLAAHPEEPLAVSRAVQLREVCPVVWLGLPCPHALRRQRLHRARSI